MNLNDDEFHKISELMSSIIVYLVQYFEKVSIKDKYIE